MWCGRRGKFEGAEGHILELQEQVDQLQAAVATAQEAVQEHLAMREKQTDRIKKAKNAGPKSKQTAPFAAVQCVLGCC